jgi:tetratricopeptide (TPR) repeat protein
MLMEGSGFAALRTKCEAFRNAYNYAAELYQLVHASPVAPDERTAFDLMLAHAYRRCSQHAKAMAIYRKLHNLLPPGEDYNELMRGMGEIYWNCANYDTAYLCYRQGNSPLSACLYDILLRSARASYAEYRYASDPCICKHCATIGWSFLLCTCERAWYCNERCRQADALAHEAAGYHAIVSMDCIPTDVIMEHLLPFCLATIPYEGAAEKLLRRQDSVGQRRFGLGLRTLSRRWRRCIDQYRPFWLEIVQQPWLPQFRIQPKEAASLTRDHFFSHMLEAAKKQCACALDRKQALLNKRWYRNEAKILELEREQQTILEQRDAYGSRLKKLKE